MNVQSLRLTQAQNNNCKSKYNTSFKATPKEILDVLPGFSKVMADAFKNRPDNLNLYEQTIKQALICLDKWQLSLSEKLTYPLIGSVNVPKNTELKSPHDRILSYLNNIFNFNSPDNLRIGHHLRLFLKAMKVRNPDEIELIPRTVAKIAEKTH